MAFQYNAPLWNAPGSNPTANLVNNGFVAGYKPPASVFNWFWYNASHCIQELQRKFDNYGAASTVYVDIKSEATTEDGSIFAPFKSIQAALDAITDDAVINISPDVYAENVTCSSNHHIMLQGAGAIGQRMTSVTGSMTVDEASEGVGMSGINFSDGLYMNSTDGGLYFDNCHFSTFVCGQTSSGTIVMDFCEFDADMQAYGTANMLFRNTDFGTGTGVLFARGNGLTATGPTIQLDSCLNVALNHMLGAIIVSGNTRFKKYAANYCINSTAEGIANPLLLWSGTTAQEDGTFGVINQGLQGGYYAIGNFIHALSGDTFNGTRLNVGMQANDIYDTNDYSGTELTPAGNFVSDTLQALANLANEGADLETLDPIAIGNSATLTEPEENSILIGPNTGYYDKSGSMVPKQGSSVMIGRNVASYVGSLGVAIGWDSTIGFILPPPNPDQGVSGMVAIGYNSQARASAAIAIGQRSFSGNDNAIAIGSSVNTGAAIGSIAIGSDITLSNQVTDGYTIAIGFQAAARSKNSIAIGRSASAAANSALYSSVAIGNYANASGGFAIGIGHSALAIANTSISIGTVANAAGVDTIAIGNRSASNGLRAVAIGSCAKSTADSSIALGFNATTTDANGYGSIAIGNRATVNGGLSIAIGQYSTTTGNQGISVGYFSNAVESSAALGVNAGAIAVGSISIGYNSISSALNSVSIGASASSESTGAISIGALAVSRGGTAIGTNSNSTSTGISIGTNTLSTTGVAVGYQAFTYTGVAVGRQSVANGTGGAQVAVGTSASSTGGSAIAIGENSNAASMNAIAIGASARITNLSNKSIAIGFGANTTGGDDSIAIGSSAGINTAAAISIGSLSAVPYGAIAAIALGYNARVSTYATNSISIGTYTLTNGANSVSIGFAAKASGANSTAVGMSSEAANIDALGLGHSASAQGRNSISIGTGSSTAGINSAVFGPGITQTAANTFYISQAYTSLSCPVQWTPRSDGRDKTDIANATKSTDLVRSLRPVVYKDNKREYYIFTEEEIAEREIDIETWKYKIDGKPYDYEAYQEATKKHSRTYVGFIAQEIQDAIIETYGDDDSAGNIVYDDHYEREVEDGHESKLSVAYSSLIPHLVGTIQELYTKVEDLEKELKHLKK